MSQRLKEHCDKSLKTIHNDDTSQLNINIVRTQISEIYHLE